MPENYSSPGVYIAEEPSDLHPIAGVATSITAFIGRAAMGPICQPVECRSYGDYTSSFGAPVAGANLAESVQQFFANGGSHCFVVRLAKSVTSDQTSLEPSASDGDAPTLADYLGDAANRTGLFAFDSVDLFNIMVTPGDGIRNEAEWGAFRAAAAAYCQGRRAFLLLDAPAGWAKAGVLNVTASDVQAFRTVIGDADINCAVYYPRVQINDNATLRYVGASGAIAGMIAAMDDAHGIWKAPAGLSASLAGVVGLEVALTDAQNEGLNPQAVNCLRSIRQGYFVWSARTVAGFDTGDTNWRYISVRRMTLFLEESLYRGTKWVVFEPNGEPLWARIRTNISAFMISFFRQGAFQGSTSADAFFVKCDAQTTTQADIDQGVLNIVVGFAPLRPAEFVVIRIQQLAGSA
jgi:phage tail sheath protein FI